MEKRVQLYHFSITRAKIKLIILCNGRPEIFSNMEGKSTKTFQKKKKKKRETPTESWLVAWLGAEGSQCLHDSVGNHRSMLRHGNKVEEAPF